MGGGGTGNLEKSQPFGLARADLRARGRLRAHGGRPRRDRRPAAARPGRSGIESLRDPPPQALGLGLRGPAAAARAGGAGGRRGRARAPRLRRRRRSSGPSRSRTSSCAPPRARAARVARRRSAAATTYERAAHAYGKSYRDVVRAFRGRFDHPPDVVAHPARRGGARGVLAWCEEAGAAAIPFGGGTSVVGGVEPPRERPAVTIDLKRSTACSRWTRSLARGADPGGRHRARRSRTSSRARADAAPLPAVVRVLDARRLDRHPRGRPLRHPPHAHRRLRGVGAGAHAARASGRAAGCPGSGAGPSPDRLLIGSEGILGVITEAWMRVQDAPRFKESTAVAVRLVRGGCARPCARCRSPASTRRTAGCSTPGEAGSDRRRRRRAGRCSCSASSPPTTRSSPWMARALELCARPRRPAVASGGGAAARGGRGRLARRLPPGALPARHARRRRHPRRDVRDRDHLGPLRRASSARVRERARERARRRRDASPAGSRTSIPTARRPTSRCSPRPGAATELEQWDEVKAAASEAITAAGGTITHHHAVGRDHRPWYDRQRPEPFAHALRAAKAARRPGRASSTPAC